VLWKVTGITEAGRLMDLELSDKVLELVPVSLRS
jgi:hypothetical protein